MVGKSTTSNAATVNLILTQGHGRRFLERKRRMVAALEAVIERGITTGKYVQGSCVAALEERIDERWNVAAAVAVNSGSSALCARLESWSIVAGATAVLPVVP